jgi:hypothetical protein
MKRKIFVGCAGISTALFLIFMGLFIYAWTANPNLYFESHHYFPIIGKIKMTVTKLWGGNILFFNQEAPYTGGIISMTSSKSNIQTVSEKGWDGFGLYFRLIQDAARKDSW